jgi:hypothetical protein
MTDERGRELVKDEIKRHFFRFRTRAWFLSPLGYACALTVVVGCFSEEKKKRGKDMRVCVSISPLVLLAIPPSSLAHSSLFLSFLFLLTAVVVL